MQDQAGDDVNIIFGAMYDDSNTDACDVTVIATGIGRRDSIPNNYTSFNNRKPAAPKQQTFSSYQGASSRPAAQPARPANTQTNVRSSVKQESLDIPSFLRQPPRR